ncbi:hypothetical protein LCGC14_1152080 [marine sediment metagenome]|uniref:Uncharacterized protein n=1 Tax=marine sediment metagenome TaxID=412755 RepID=A0A0F9Q0Q7_9ZZZZ
MKIKLFRKKEECYSCMDVKHLLIKSRNQLLCKICYRKELKFLFEIFEDILDNFYTCFGYTTEQMNQFRAFNLGQLKTLIYHHFTISKDHYIGSYKDEMYWFISNTIIIILIKKIFYLLGISLYSFKLGK